MLPLVWPGAAALGAAGVVLALGWAEQHGATVTDDVVVRWESAFGFVLVGWAYLLAAAGVLAALRVPRRWRLALAHLFPLALWGALSRTPDEGGLVRFTWADVFFTFPAVEAAHVIPHPTYASACTVDYWDLRRRGYYASAGRLVELTDGSVLVDGGAERTDRDSGAPGGSKLARVLPDGRPDTAFALGRGCADAVDAVAGPGASFSYAWSARPAASVPGRVALLIPWRDVTGRPTHPPFPAAPGAIPQWADSQPLRPTPVGGAVLVGEIPAGSADGNARYGVVRVLADGRYDPAFTPWPIPRIDSTRCLAARAGRGGPGSPAAQEACSPALGYQFLPAAARELPDGGLLVRLHREVDDSGRLVRLGPDGRRDVSFERRTAVALAPFAAPTAVAVDAAGRVLVGVGPRMPRYDSAGYKITHPDQRRLLRLRADGGEDTSFRADSVDRGDVRAIYPQSDGHLVLDFRASRGWDGQDRERLVRVDARGRVDSAFRARVERAGGRYLGAVLVRRDGSVVAVAGTGVLVLAPGGRVLAKFSWTSQPSDR